MQRRNPPGEPYDRQARIRELEQELGIEPGPEVEFIRLRERIELLSAQRKEILAASGSMSNQEQRQELAGVERQLWEAIQEVTDANQKVSTYFNPRPRRGVDIQVHTQGRNRWLVRVRTVEGEGREEKVREFHVVGRRHRKAMELLRNANRARRSEELDAAF